MGGLSSESYCPVCGLPGEWEPTPQCPHREKEIRDRDLVCAVCGLILAGEKRRAPMGREQSGAEA